MNSYILLITFSLFIFSTHAQQYVAQYNFASDSTCSKPYQAMVNTVGCVGSPFATNSYCANNEYFLQSCSNDNCTTDSCADYSITPFNECVEAGVQYGTVNCTENGAQDYMHIPGTLVTAFYSGLKCSPEWEIPQVILLFTGVCYPNYGFNATQGKYVVCTETETHYMVCDDLDCTVNCQQSGDNGQLGCTNYGSENTSIDAYCNL